MTDEETKQRIQSRIDGRTQAELVLSLIDDKVTDTEYMLSFLARINGACRSTSVVPQVVHEPIARLGATMMPFGVHKDKPLDEIPLEYLDWLCRSQEDFYKNLRAYLKHPDLKTRRGAEVDG